MTKHIFLTGATDGIGLDAAKKLAKLGHHLYLHGRNEKKLLAVKEMLLAINPSVEVALFRGDLSSIAEVKALIAQVLGAVEHLDVLVNNAGVFVVEEENRITEDGMDVRFMVNTLAPYLLTCGLTPLLNKDSRVVNISSAAQMPPDVEGLLKGKYFPHDMAYAQSKLAIIMWANVLAEEPEFAPMIVSVNPKSYLGSKMVKVAYGKEGFDIGIGGDVILKAALSEEFSGANGKYYDNDYGVFGIPHPCSEDKKAREALVKRLDTFR